MGYRPAADQSRGEADRAIGDHRHGHRADWAFVLPVIVTAAGHSDWVLPSIAITIGPLLLWLDHEVHITRYRAVGWLLTIGPVILVAAMSGSSLAATTGIAAGVILLATAATGFHNLAGIRTHRATP